MLPFGKRARSSVKRSVEVARVRMNYRCFHRDSRKSMVTMKFSSPILFFFSFSSFFIESIETLSLRRERNFVISIDYVNVNRGQWEQKNWIISLSLRPFTRELLWKRVFRILYASLARLFEQFVEEWPGTIVFEILLSGKRSVYTREIYEDDST